MKICLINNILRPFDRGGGAERISEIIRDGFSDAGDDVFTLSLRPVFKNSQGKKAYYLKSYFYNLYKMPLFLKLFWHFNNLFNFNNFIKIFFIFKKEKPDLIITNNLMGVGMLLPFLIKILKIKHVHILHDIQLIYPSGLMFYGQEEKIEKWPIKIYLKITRFLFASPDYIISPSKWLLDMHDKNNFFKKSEKKVIQNPAIIFNAKKEKKEKNIFRFLYVGQIEEHKGINILINAFKKLQKNYFSDIELEIAGSGTLFNKFKNENTECPEGKNNNSIKFLGKINNREVRERMEEADCLIVPSLCYENSPTVIYEALSSQVPVIASNLGGIPELLGRNRGLLFIPGSEEDLLEKMIFLKKYPSEGKDMVNQGFSYILNKNKENYISEMRDMIN